ncbi:glycoside hydrolase domain-containing protein [Kribbella sp. NPDC055071]
MRLFKPGVLSLALTLVAGVAATGPAVADETQTVSYHGYEVTVPASWPVVDLSKTPTACVRLDRPAVYLGRGTAQADCPAHLVGRSSGLLLEPLTAAQPSTDGLLRRAVPDAGVLATAYYVPGDVQAASAVLATGRVVSKSQSARVAQPAAVTPSILASGNFAGYGFDTCDAPSQASMDAWQADYKGIGIYISGGLRACGQSNLTSDWVAANAAKGWQFLLIDVGKQAPCTSYSDRISTNPVAALREGRTAATNAVTAAQALGFSQRSAIYSDIEAYNSTVECKAAVLSYLSGWTQELTSRGYVGGAYVGAGSGGADLSGAYTSTAYAHPENLWFAHWGSTPVGTSPYIGSTYWNNHQRVHQFAGERTETHGNVTMKVDRNYLNLTAPPLPVSSLKVTGGVNVATLQWGLPANTTLGKIIVRGTAGSVPPPLPTSGTAIYSGTGKSAAATGLVNSGSYAYRAWVVNSAGKTGPGVDVRLVGTKSTIAPAAASIVYTGSVTVATVVTRLDTSARVAGAPVTLYAKTKTGTKWVAIGQYTSDANGVVSSVQKPTVSISYMWGYNGAAGLLGTRSAAAVIQVKPAISSYLTPTIKLGTSTLFYGYLNPPHAGMPAYLQVKSGTKWVGVATGKLSANGKYGFTIKPTARGTYIYRVVWLPDADHQGTQTPSKQLTVS